MFTLFKFIQCQKYAFVCHHFSLYSFSFTIVVNPALVCDRRLDTYFVMKGCKEKERKSRFGENNARGVYVRLVTI